MERNVQHVFIVGSKGVPGAYGGYETFVDKLTEYHQDNGKIKYHIACKGTKYEEFEYHNARCFKVPVPDMGAAQAVYYDLRALNLCCEYIKKKEIQHAILYVLACRIGPFVSYFRKEIHRLGGVLYVNPDGHEWMRQKWSVFIRKYWKVSERLMVKHADLLICDSKNIEIYIHNEYKRYSPRTMFIPYGAETRTSLLNDSDEIFVKWMKSKGLSVKEYYLMVGRFVPENNFEFIIKEFMRSRTKRDLAIITNVNSKFLKELEDKLQFNVDKRIKFVGTVYDVELLKKIRENAYGYIHGHQVGGTNPSLLEALGSTEVNLLLDVSFNREAGEDGALYWRKEEGELASLINEVEQMNRLERKNLGTKAITRIKNAYSWEKISDKYEKLWINC